MTEPSTIQPRERDSQFTVGIAVVAVLAIPVGLVGQRLHRGWAAWVIWIGVGLTLGALAYITIGLLTPDGPSSGGGSA